MRVKIKKLSKTEYEEITKDGYIKLNKKRYALSAGVKEYEQDVKCVIEYQKKRYAVLNDTQEPVIVALLEEEKKSKKGW